MIGLKGDFSLHGNKGLQAIWSVPFKVQRCRMPEVYLVYKRS